MLQNSISVFPKNILSRWNVKPTYDGDEADVVGTFTKALATPLKKDIE